LSLLLSFFRLYAGGFSVFLSVAPVCGLLRGLVCFELIFGFYFDFYDDRIP